MKLSDLIDRLLVIQNETDDDPKVSIMTEVESCSNDIGMQINHTVTDIAFSNRSGVIIIGQEVD